MNRVIKGCLMFFFFHICLSKLLLFNLNDLMFRSKHCRPFPLFLWKRCSFYDIWVGCTALLRKSGNQGDGWRHCGQRETVSCYWFEISY